MDKMGRAFKQWHFISHDTDICACGDSSQFCLYCKAREVALEDCDVIDKEYEALEKKVEILTKAVEFYADKENYDDTGIVFHIEKTGVVDESNGYEEWQQYQDQGGLASKTLEGIKAIK